MTCSVVGCDARHEARGWCEKHYRRWQKHGDPLMTLTPNYGSGWLIDASGYVRVRRPDHPLAHARGWVLEHRMIAWDAGLFTDPSWEVHHKNHIRNDNRLENLEPMPSSDHRRLHSPGSMHAAKTHCPAGHPYDEANTYYWRDERKCRACQRDSSRRYYWRQKVASA